MVCGGCSWKAPERNENAVKMISLSFGIISGREGGLIHLFLDSHHYLSLLLD